jgi:hypothetical protein
MLNIQSTNNLIFCLRERLKVLNETSLEVLVILPILLQDSTYLILIVHVLSDRLHHYNHENTLGLSQMNKFLEEFLYLWGLVDKR